MSQASKLPKDARTEDERLPADLAPLKDQSESLPGKGIDPDQHSSVRAKEAFAAAELATQVNDEDQAVHHYLRCAAAAEAAHEWYLVALSCERVGEFLLNPKPPTDFDRALRMFRRAVAAYEQSGLSTEARELSYRVSLLRLSSFRDVAMPMHHRLELFLYWLTAGFGYRPMRVIATSACVIVFYGIVFWLINGAVENENGNPAGLLDSLYFSGITFTTVGYGDLMPAPHVRLLAMTEGFFGAFLMGFFVVVLAHRIARL